VVIILAVNAVKAQDPISLQEKYGFPQETTYKIRSGIVLKARFTKEGKPCSMLIEPDCNQGTNYKLIPISLTKEILDELVPIDQRIPIPEDRDNWLNSDIIGSVNDPGIFEHKRYVNLTITYVYRASESDKGYQRFLIQWNESCNCSDEKQ
jgi:hypothetical protein